jgi:hypothetical protein
MKHVVIVSTQSRKGVFTLTLLLLSLYSFSSCQSTIAQPPQKATTELPIENTYKRNQNNTVSYSSKKNGKKPVIDDKRFFTKLATVHSLIFQIALAANENVRLNIKSMRPSQSGSQNIYFSEKSSFSTSQG